MHNDAADALTLQEWQTGEHSESIGVGQAIFEADSDIPQTQSSLPLEFRDAQAVYGSRSTIDIVRTLAVLKLCSVRPLVSNADAILDFVNKIHLSWVSDAVVRATFGVQFLAGETSEDILARMDEMRRSATYGIPNLSFELDQGEEVTDKLCDQVADRLKDSIRIAALGTPVDRVAFTGIKITGIADPTLLADLTSFLAGLNKVLVAKDADGDGQLSKSEFREALTSIGLSASDADQLYRSEGVILDLVDGLDFSQPATWCLLQASGAESRLTDTDMQALRALLARLDGVLSAARAQGVRVLLDAEQTYFQPAIDLLFIHLARKYNKLDEVEYGPRVYNTYQMYLRKSLAKLQRDTRRAESEGFAIGGKLVRGAYMVTERARAAKLGYEDPIQPTKEATDQAYDAGLAFLIRQPTKNKSRLFVATHNEQSVQTAVALMAEHGSTPLGLEATVHFGQLLGMSDNLTTVLGAKGYSAYKYLPYGPMEEVLPYLVRRAQENSSVLGATENERVMLKSELSRRASDLVRAVVG